MNENILDLNRCTAYMIDKEGNRTEIGEITTCETTIDSIKDIKFNGKIIAQTINKTNTINIKSDK